MLTFLFDNLNDYHLDSLKDLKINEPNQFLKNTYQTSAGLTSAFTGSDLLSIPESQPVPGLYRMLLSPPLYFMVSVLLSVAFISMPLLHKHWVSL